MFNTGKQKELKNQPALGKIKMCRRLEQCVMWGSLTKAFCLQYSSENRNIFKQMIGYQIIRAKCGKNVSKMVREFLLRSWMCKDQIKKDIKLIKFIWFKFNLKLFKPWLFNKLYVCSVSTSFQNPLYQIAPVLHLASDLVKWHGCLILAMHWKDVFCLDWNRK